MLMSAMLTGPCPYTRNNQGLAYGGATYPQPPVAAQKAAGLRDWFLHEGEGNGGA